MITHPNPKRVAIVGGGEGATLREVLKHNTVEEVLMVEIDGELVTMCREHLPEWSDCTDLLGSDADSCFEDSRATVSFEDAFGWFIDNFGDGKKKREQFDVIIMDALDPDKFIEIVGSLYKDDQFVKSIFHGLTDEGVVSSILCTRTVLLAIIQK
jgi:spermidine synthase